MQALREEIAKLYETVKAEEVVVCVPEEGELPAPAADPRKDSFHSPAVKQHLTAVRFLAAALHPRASCVQYAVPAMHVTCTAMPPMVRCHSKVPAFYSRLAIAVDVALRRLLILQVFT